MTPRRKIEREKRKAVESAQTVILVLVLLAIFVKFGYPHIAHFF